MVVVWCEVLGDEGRGRGSCYEVWLREAARNTDWIGLILRVTDSSCRVMGPTSESVRHTDYIHS